MMGLTFVVGMLGSDYWPETTEGKILCLDLSIYAFAIFGYITAIMTNFFIEKDKKLITGVHKPEPQRKSMPGHGLCSANV